MNTYLLVYICIHLYGKAGIYLIIQFQPLTNRVSSSFSTSEPVTPSLTVRMLASNIFHMYYLISPSLWAQSMIHPFPLMMPPHPQATPTSEHFGFPHPCPAAIPANTLPSLLGLWFGATVLLSGPTQTCEAAHFLWPTFGFRTGLSRKRWQAGEGEGREGAGKGKEGLCAASDPTETDQCT